MKLFLGHVNVYTIVLNGHEQSAKFLFHKMPIFKHNVLYYYCSLSTYLIKLGTL